MGLSVSPQDDEAAYETNIVVIPLVLALIFGSVTFSLECCTRADHDVGDVVCDNAFLCLHGITGIGITVNTVPIIAGYWCGIDYSILHYGSYSARNGGEAIWWMR